MRGGYLEASEVQVSASHLLPTISQSFSPAELHEQNETSYGVYRFKVCFKEEDE